MWESPIYKPQVEPRWSISCGKSLFTNSTCCLEERFMWKISIYKTQLQRFVWEIPIYKLNWSVSCGKYLFTNSTAAFGVGNSYLQTQLERFRVGNFYLQTQLQRFVWEIPIYKLNWSVSCGKISIYKLNWSVSCGKFLFTNSTSVFSLFTNYFQTYLQTYLQTSFLREKAFSRRAIHGQESFNQTLDFICPCLKIAFSLKNEVCK